MAAPSRLPGVVVALLMICASVARAEPAPATQPATVQELLDRTVPEVRFDGVALSDTLDFLRDVTGANLAVDWRALTAKIDKNAPVGIRLRDTILSDALVLILQDVGDGLDFQLDRGVITISAAPATQPAEGDAKDK